MRTYSTIISLIFLVACANATKSVSYSDIVYSLMEVNEDNNTVKGLENLNKINISFAESKEKLVALDARLQVRCASTLKMGAEKLQSQGRQLIALEKSKSEFLEKQAAARQAQESAKQFVSVTQEEIRAIQEKLVAEKAEFLRVEKHRAERYMIYGRLINYVQDELNSTGAQRKTQMGGFNVDKSFSGKTAFVQFEVIRSDLAKISAKTADPMAKSMITTLLMITQASDKNFFMNPELVQKIKSLIESLMKKEAEANKAEQEALIKNTNAYNAMIHAKAEEADGKKEEQLMNVAEIAALEQSVRNFENEIKAFARAQEKQRKKNAVQDQMCQKLEAMLKLHKADFDTFEAQFKDLQVNLA